MDGQDVALGHMTWWNLLAKALLPLPILLVALLSTPLPRQARRKVLWFVEHVLNFEVRRPVTVLHFALLLSGGSLAATVPAMLQAEAEVRLLDDKRDPNILVLLLSRQFRCERNFWISALTLAAWLALWVVFRVNREKHELRGRLLAAQGRPTEAAGELAFLKDEGRATLAAAAKKGE